MPVVSTSTVPGTVTQQRYLDWAAVIAGAVGASAISFLLLTFGASIGLSMTSPWAGSGTSAYAALLAVAWWAVLVQIGAFFGGGYLAGRMRTRWAETPSLDESRFRDGAHGFLVWSLGVIVGAILLGSAAGSAISAAGSVAKTGAQAASTVAGGAASGNAGALQTNPADYALDSLMRPAARTGGTQTGGAAAGSTAAPSGSADGTAATPGATAGATSQQQRPSAEDTSAFRSEAGRIFASSIKNGELTQRDRDYLAQMVAQRTGMSEQEAQQRVDQSVEQLKDLEVKARAAAADKARKAALIAGFIAAAALLISLAAAVAGAGLGGRHRDENVAAHIFGTRIW